jgi:lipopolysaccharide/colanic/teichoic acid biosynthesis glycosyltransferase
MRAGDATRLRRAGSLRRATPSATAVRSGHLLGRLVAAIALLGLSPLLAAAAAAIKLFDGGPVLYRAARAGRFGTPFVMFKFRTMRECNGDAASRITGGDDPRVSAVGRWLRRFKVDELPQLANVVAGQMAIVGPRPEDPTIVAEHYTPLMMSSLDVLPGLTSPGSLAYYAAESALPDDPALAEKVYLTQLLPKTIAMDLVYVRSRSWRYDAEVVLRTLASLAGLHTLFARRRAWEREQAELLLGAAGHRGGL